MADNITLPAQGTGDTTPIIATDKIGGVDYQRVKIGIGADGSSTDWSSTNPAPISVADAADVAQGAVADAAVTAGATGTISAKLRSISRDIALLLAQLPTTVDVNSGNKSNSTLRVVLATDQPVVPVTPAATESHLGQVGGASVVVNATYTRPSDTTAYAALDTVSNSTSSPAVLTFSNCARVNAGTGFITKARILTSQTTCVARFRLHLFLISPTAINDNAGCTAPLYADDAKYVGYVDFIAGQTGGGSPTAAFAQADGIRLAFKCDTADKNLYGILETQDAFTPASAQTFSITLSCEQD